MVAKKRATKVKSKKDDVNVSIKVKNLDKAVKSAKDIECKSGGCCSSSNCGGNLWVFGSALAMVLSYVKNASILWAIVHGILSWFYVIYHAIRF